MVFVSHETLKKTVKKRSNVSCETLHVYTFICIFIQIKGVRFCGIQIHKLHTILYTVYIVYIIYIVHMYTITLYIILYTSIHHITLYTIVLTVYRHTSIHEYMYICIIIYILIYCIQSM